MSLDANDVRRMGKPLIDSAGEPMKIPGAEPPPSELNGSTERANDAANGGGSMDNGVLPTIELDAATLPAGVDPSTGLAQAHRIARYFRDELRHDPGLGWMVFDGRVWQRDEKAAMRRAILVARAMCRHADKLLRENKRAQHEAKRAGDKEGLKGLEKDEQELQRYREIAVKQQEQHGLANALKIASTLESIAVDTEVWDRDPWLFNVANGTIDLRSRELRPHDPADYITQISPVEFDPAATAPRWMKFQEEVHPKLEIRAFNQRHYGYCMAGLIREHALVVCWGGGRNGKSTETEVIRHVKGTYAGEAAGGTFVAGQQNGRGPDNKLAKLRGKRLVTTSESSEGHRLNEELVKRVTGGDTVTANFLYEEYFDYNPTYKIRLTTNHRPEIRGTEDAIWSRIKLIPYEVSFLGRENTGLTAELKAEAPGILNWLLDGCAEWQRQGLNPPAAVTAFTDEWRAEANEIAEFIADQCVTGPYMQRDSADLYAAYRKWAHGQGRDDKEIMKSNAFGRKLTDAGYALERSSGSRFRKGIDLRPQSATDASRSGAER